MLQHFNADIICVGETHLRKGEKLSLPGYEFFDHSRETLHKRAPKGSGGTGFFVKTFITNEYDMNVDKSQDGIFVMKFTHKKTSYSFAVINVYLPPSNSPWGRNATSFMAHLLSNIYSLSDCDALYLVGDVNSRISHKKDYVPNVDSLVDRKVLDETVNKHGEVFIDFLLESKMCILNGRVCPENNNFTRVHTTGSSVVDYICTSHDNIQNCEYFAVHLTRQLLNTLNIQVDKVPDHSVLELHFNVHYNDFVTSNQRSSQTPVYINNDSDMYFKRYNVRDVPVDFMNSELARLAIIQCIDRIQSTRAIQDDIDLMYNDFCNMYYREMDHWFRSRNINQCGRRKFRNSSKPFWTEQLTALWSDVCTAESNYLAAPQHSQVRKHLLATFKDTQHIFDRTYRREKRRFEREKRTHIERLNTDNPREFWAELNKLGPKRNDSIPMEVYDDNGNILVDTAEVLQKWKIEFEGLYKGYEKSNFDENAYNAAMQEKAHLENVYNNINDDSFNVDITYGEVAKVLNKAKYRKAIGIDNLPYEVLKNEASHNILMNLFSKIFTTKITPSVWRKAIIKPIPKNSTIDPRLPLQYRGIALLSTVYKLYSCILNNRIVYYCENDGIFVEEQNGFRQKRSCAEHIFTLTTILRNRLSCNLPTYAAFLDAEKAFDRIDRDLMLYKLLKIGIKGHLYENIKCIYSEATCSINVNNILTEWFATESGVIQGDTLSPTLFNIFINDMVSDVNSLNLGIPLDNECVSILLYADDIVVLSENEDNLQCILDTIYSWSRKNLIKFNEKKSNVIHFRKSNTDRSEFNFKLGQSTLSTVDQYKYLGIILNEFLDYNVTVKTLANAANRALGAVINKYQTINGFGYYTYTSLFKSGICPILDYCSEVWGYKNYPEINAIQNKAIRIFLGVHRFAPIAALNGDMGWTQSYVRRHICMLRHWNRLINMDNCRLPKKVFQWDLSLTGNTWSSEIKNILYSVNKREQFDNRECVNLTTCWALLHELSCNKWKNEVDNKPKLRTYKCFKEKYEPEPYVLSLMSKKQRSCLAQIRCGILPIEIETGRWYGTKYEDRKCKVCSNGNIENELHFLFHCEAFNAEREQFYDNVLIENFMLFDDNEKLNICMTKDKVNLFSKFLCNIYKKRQSILYN